LENIDFFKILLLKQWTEGVFKWSPHGTYLASVHDQGVMLWAGEKFQKFQRFQHDGVNFIEFSPNEKWVLLLKREKRKRMKNKFYFEV
jgi:uncharacterized protein with WD repeat